MEGLSYHNFYIHCLGFFLSTIIAEACADSQQIARAWNHRPCFSTHACSIPSVGTEKDNIPTQEKFNGQAKEESAVYK